MTQEEKQLLLQDLSARLPYGVKCTTKSSWNGIYTIVGYKDNNFFLDCPVYGEGDDEWMIESIVPYLRPMSSMTEEERGYYNNHLSGIITGIDAANFMIWVYSNHFDIFHLIEKGLAIEVTEENTPYKE